MSALWRDDALDGALDERARGDGHREVRLAGTGGAEPEGEVVRADELDVLPLRWALRDDGTSPGRDEDDLVELIEANRINLALFPSVCPETFSYVTEEMIRLELPIVAFDLGAPGERLRSYRNGRLAPDVSAASALANHTSALTSASV